MAVKTVPVTGLNTHSIGSFLGELSKRLLKLPRWNSNTPASIMTGLASARALCLTHQEAPLAPKDL